MAGSRSTPAGLLVLFQLALASAGSAQSVAVGDPVEDYLRLLQIGGADVPGSFTVRSVWDDVDWASAAGTPGAWGARLAQPGRRGGGAPAGRSAGVSLLDSRFGAWANSRFPTGQNDGPVWQGRGFTGALEAGATGRWGALTVTLRPLLLFTQNSETELAPVLIPEQTEYAYPWRFIDLPQRFGPDAFWTLDPGQSEVRLDFHGASAGVSAANLWWGPGIRNAIVMSNNAPGFPHAFLGTDGPLDVGIGELEARWIWGRLQQSDWFAPSFPTTKRFITGAVLAYSPEFAPGLTLGATRLFYMLGSGSRLSDWFAVFAGVRRKDLVSPTNPEGLDDHDQLLSLFGRWALPESGFEVYTEWARNDHAWDVRDFLLEPEHSQAYTLGLQKAFALSGERTLAVRGELTHLEADPTFQVRGKGTYYEHYLIKQGYTQRGQIIGAAAGPGGNSQHIGVDMYAPWGRWRAWLQRDVHDNDAYYTWAEANERDYCCHDVSFRLGLDGLWFLDDFDLGAGAVVTREMNRWFYGLDLWNLNLSASVRWRRP